MRRPPTVVDAGRQYHRPEGVLSKVPEGAAGTGRPALAGGARRANLREHLRRSLENVGRTDEDDPQRVPADALAETGPGAGAEAHGGLLLRRGRRPPARLRPPAGQRLAGRVGGDGDRLI